MKRVLLLIVVLGAAVAVRADRMPNLPAPGLLGHDPPEIGSSLHLSHDGYAYGYGYGYGRFKIDVHEQPPAYGHLSHGEPDFSPTPEPTTILMLGTGLGMLGAARRKLLRR